MTCRKAAVLLDRYATDELSAHERSQVALHLDGCDACTRTLAGIKTLRGVIVSARTETAPPVLPKTRPEQRMRFSSLRLPHYLSAAAVAAAAVILVMVLPSRMNERLPQWFNDTTRIKGTNAIYIYLKNGESQTLLTNGTFARKGDVFQIAYIVHRGRYGVLFSIDGRGGVTLHHPQSAGESSELAQNRETCLNRANELDDAPRYEKFYLAVSAKAMDAASVVVVAKKAAQDRTRDIDTSVISALSNCTVTTFTLRKP
ncbi:MAG: zf-HC2 domain-containing protein [Spirochaetes bacterium]|nr:zf-HC2 domain-containing protein [Spirochaetota bacterium]